MLPWSSLGLMLLPVAVGLALAGRRPRWVVVRESVGAFRGAWLCVVAAAWTALLTHATFLHGAVVSRAWVNLAAVGGLVVLNRSTRSMAARLGLVLVIVGATSNAVVMLLYGAMPFDPEAAAQAGYLATEIATPHAGYVPLPPGDVVGRVLGDVLPVAASHRVLSVGDVALLSGASLLVRSVVRGRWPVRTGGRRVAPATSTESDDLPARAGREV